MRSFGKILLAGSVGAAGGLIAISFIVPLLARVGFWNTAAILNGPATLPQPTESPKAQPNPTPQLNFFSDAINKIQPGVVAVQSFSGGALVRHGSGTMLTQDGLIATLNSIVPAGAIIQVTNDGKIYKANVVYRDYVKNIAIISVISEDSLRVVRLNLDMPALGQKLLIFGREIDFSEDGPLIDEVLVSQVNSKNGQFKVSLDYDPGFYGAAVSDNSGSMLGLLDYKSQKPVVVYSKIIEETLNAHLTQGGKL